MSAKQDRWSKAKLILGTMHRISFQWICLVRERTLVQGHGKLRGGQLSLCADLWAILSHFDLSSDDGVAGKDSGVEGLGTGGRWGETAPFVFVLFSFWA